MTRYIIVSSLGIEARDTITKQDLVDVKKRVIDALIDLRQCNHGAYYDAEANTWQPIKFKAV